jgi:hypothetical protein
MPLLLTDQDVAAAFGGLPDDLRAMFDYWRAKAGARTMPARTDIEPSEIKRFLPSMILVDVRYDAAGRPDFVYRLVGTREVEVRGEDPTGQRVAEAFHGPSVENVLGCYMRVVESGKPFLDDEYFLRDGDNFADEANIFLPLSGDGKRINMILVYTAYRRIR